MAERIQLTRDIEVQAAAGDGKQPSVSILAYGGDVIRPNGWNDLVIDVKGVSAADQLPLLLDHDATTSGVTGHGVATMRNGTITVDGKLIPGIAATEKLLALHQGGLKLQASVGLEPTKTRRLSAGEKITINGRTITAGERGLTVVDAGTLKEVSILPLAADGGTSVSIAAREGLKNMTTTTNDDTNTQDDVLQAERERCSAIAKLAGKHPDIVAKAIGENWDAQRTELEVLRASRPTGPALQVRGNERFDGDGSRRILAAALSLRIGNEDSTAKHFGEQSVAYARRAGLTCSLVDLCKGALQLEGRTIPASRNGLIKAAFSTTSLPTSISDALHFELKRHYADSTPTWKTFAAVKSAADFRDHGLIQPHLAGELEELGGTGEVAHSSLDTNSFPFSIGTFAKQFRASRKDVINDHISLFADLPASLARMSQRSVANKVYTVLLANAGSHFASGNNNYLSGGSSPLSSTSLASAHLKLRRQVDASNNPLDLVPTTLLVCPELEVTSRELLNSTEISRDTSTDSKLPTGNSFKDSLTLAVEPRLSNSSYSGYSTTGWYLFATAADLPFIVGFLDGAEVPMVDTFDLSSDIDSLGYGWRVVHDFGASLGDPAASVLSAGA